MTNRIGLHFTEMGGGRYVYLMRKIMVMLGFYYISKSTCQVNNFIYTSLDFRLEIQAGERKAAYVVQTLAGTM